MADEWANDDTEDFETDTEGVDIASVDKERSQVDKEGWYHFEIVDVVNELNTLSHSGKEKPPCVRFDLRVLEEVNGQSPGGSMHFHRIYLGGKGNEPQSDRGRELTLKFGMRLGLLIEQNEKIVTADTNKTRFGVALWHTAKGMQIIASIKCEPGTGGFSDRYQIPFNEIFLVDDDRVTKVPKNREALALIGNQELAAGKEKGEVTAKPAGGGLDDLSDL
jgi:hypothetical protein